jgi:hypothetical protein
MLYKNLTTQMTVGDCQGKTAVSAGDAANSLLAQAIEKGISKAICTGATMDIPRMPLGCANMSSKCLSQPEIDTITSWITSGAKNM